MGADAAAFPAWSEADWRKAAEAALKGKSLDSLTSCTADGHPRRAALRGGRRPPSAGTIGTVAGHGPA